MVGVFVQLALKANEGMDWFGSSDVLRRGAVVAQLVACR